MNCIIKETFATPTDLYKAGELYNLPRELAISLLSTGMADPSDRLTPDQQDHADRLWIGAGKPCIFLPCYGLEFGHEVLHRARYIHAHTASYKVVYCKPGNEILYPSADEFLPYEDHIPDSLRAGAGRDFYGDNFSNVMDKYPEYINVPTGGWTYEQEVECYYPLHLPLTPKVERGLECDVLLGIRYREFCKEKNWPKEHWETLAKELRAEGYTVGVAGMKPHTLDIDGQLFHAGDYDTDANVEALQKCRLFISTDTGIAHLAAACQTPSLLFRHPGFHRDFIPLMQAINPNIFTMSGCAWKHPQRIADTAMKILAGKP